MSDESLEGCESFNLMRWVLPEAAEPAASFGMGSEGRRASVSWTVRMCFARASERVKLRSHSLHASGQLSFRC